MKRRPQTEVVLDYLRTNDELTTRKAVTDLNIMCLPKRIEELRKDGVPISTTYKTSPNGCRYGVYRLEEVC